MSISDRRRAPAAVARWWIPLILAVVLGLTGLGCGSGMPDTNPVKKESGRSPPSSQPR